jgi:hypothetical protein
MALRRRWLAQSMQLATSSITVESTMWIVRRKRRATPRPMPPRENSGASVCKWPSIAQKSFSAIAAGRFRPACESVLRAGGVAPRIAESGPPWIESESHTSLSPMQWVSCA